MNLFKVSEASKLVDSAAKSSTLAAADTTTADDDNEANQGEHPEEYEPQLDFKPIVKLNEVEVKTGEEDETVLLKLRCKLFKFEQENKEWKEKGVGDLKILQHKQTQSIRILMRRDQVRGVLIVLDLTTVMHSSFKVLKLCANHKIAPDMKLTELNPKQFTWMAVDFSDEQPKSELLLARFKDADEGAKFKTEFEKAARLAQIKSPQKAPPAAPPTAPNTLNIQPKTDQPPKSGEAP